MNVLHQDVNKESREQAETCTFYFLHLYLILQGSVIMSASMQIPSHVLEELKTRIQTDDWALGGLMVIISFLSVIIALIMFAAIFGCCSTQRNKLGPI